MLKRLNEHKRLLTVDNYKLEKDVINETIPERNSVLTENTGILLRHLSVSPLFPSGEVTKRHALQSLVSSTSGSWFNPFKANCDEFSQNSFFWLHNKELSFNLTRNTISPLAVLISNFSQGKIPPQVCTVDKQLSSKQMVNTSSAIISRRDIEKVMPLLILFSSCFKIFCRLYTVYFSYKLTYVKMPLFVWRKNVPPSLKQGYCKGLLILRLSAQDSHWLSGPLSHPTVPSPYSLEDVKASSQSVRLYIIYSFFSSMNERTDARVSGAVRASTKLATFEFSTSPWLYFIFSYLAPLSYSS